MTQLASSTASARTPSTGLTLSIAGTRGASKQLGLQTLLSRTAEAALPIVWETGSIRSQ